MSQNTSTNRRPDTTGIPADLNHELTSGFAGRLIARRAGKLAGVAGFSRSDRDDIAQELRIALLERIMGFDSQRGSWPAFVTTVVDSAVASMFTPRRARSRAARQECDSLSAPVAGADGQPSMLSQLVTPDEQARVSGRAVRHHVDEVDRQEDVALVLAELSPELREIAVALMTTTPAGLARRMQIPRRTLRNRIAKIREAFEAAGYEAMLPGGREECDRSRDRETPISGNSGNPQATTSKNSVDQQ